MGAKSRDKPPDLGKEARPCVRHKNLVMHMNDEKTKQQALDELRQQVADLEAELKTAHPPTWTRSDTDYYATYLAWSGAVLGMFGAVASLLFNVIGSLAVGQNPLRLIQIYLTFPMGEKALQQGLDTGIVMAVGCCLYILTGMVLAIPLHMTLAKFLPNAKLMQRLMFGTAAGLLLWAVNFYLILAWLQPFLFGGNWITDPNLIPPWVGAATHVVFAWVVAAMYPWGTIGIRKHDERTELGHE